jgi:hypothetical protein
MIITELFNSNPYPVGAGLATKLIAPPLPEIREDAVNDFQYRDCCYEEKIFAQPGGEWWKNDKSSFLFQTFIVGDSIDIQLWKDGENLGSIVDDTYGDFYNGFASQPNYIGFVVDWEKVFDEEGAGCYKIKADLFILGYGSTFESQKFHLYPYSILTVPLACSSE